MTEKFVCLKEQDLPTKIQLDWTKYLTTNFAVIDKKSKVQVSTQVSKYYAN